MDYYRCKNELYHYGIKGMKWGVRRYQNEDGTLTGKGKKRYAKNEAYREKLAKKASRKASMYRDDAKEAEAASEDLQKHGRKSETYKKWQKEEHDRRMREFESKNKITGPDGKTYVRKYDDDFNSLFDDLFDHISADAKVQDLIDENNATARRSREAAKRWTQNNKNLMNMDISALTTKKEIKRVYRG